MNNNLIENRQIRVFISSTFRDMQDERDYLMKRTFPKLRKLAAERDVTLTELDLRWGITEEESKSGKVVEICLREIENSIPFFIGIIGNRYGWVPAKEDLGGNVTERFTDVNQYIEQHLSVTEMEMQFGVLQRKEDMHAYFYIKEGEESSKADNPEMLERLKQEVQGSRYPSSSYSSPEDLGIQVQQAFTTLLNQLFPEGHLSELEKERIGQRSFMNQLCQNYIRDDRNFQVLDEWMQDWERHQMVVTGASGLGKSALIANWVKEKLSDEHRCYSIIYHFTGNGGSESHHEHIMKVLSDEINDVYGWEEEENTNQSQEDKLNDLFLKVASEGKKSLLIVLDAINQIIDTDNAKLLNWLPIPPRNIKILFSTLEDDRTMEVFRNRHYPELVLQPLDAEKRRQLVTDYLWLYRKKLTDAQIERIVTDKQSENTLVLKTLLDELINYGVFEKLDKRIDYYLLPDTIEDFYQALLQSYEDDFGKDFVKQILSLIAVSRSGLSEDEILAITNYKQLYWSQFYCAFASHLNAKNGLFYFSHRYVQNAVWSRYLDKTDWEHSCRMAIIEEMSKDNNIRAYAELPYQYEAVGDYDSLCHQLLNLDVFRFQYKNYEYELASYWRKLFDHGYDCAIYKEKLKKADSPDGIYDTISSFFQEYFSLYDFSLSLSEILLEIRGRVLGQNHPDIATSYNNIGNVYFYKGDYDRALEYYLKAVKIKESVLGGNHPDTAMSFYNIGMIYSAKGDYDKALEYYLKAVKILESVLGANHPDTAMSYNNIGNVYSVRGDYDKALEYHLKAMKIREFVFGEYHLDTAASYDNIGNVYSVRGDYDKALAYYLKAVKIKESVLGGNHPDTATSYNNIGMIYSDKGDYDKALGYYLKALEIRESVLGANHPYTALSYNSIGSIYSAKGDYSRAMTYILKALKIRESVLGANHPDTAVSYNNIGNVYAKKDDYNKALEYYLKALEIRESALGANHPETAKSYNNIGSVYLDKGDYDKALEYYRKAMEIRESVLDANHPYTATSYNNIGNVYYHKGDYDNALKYYLKTKEIRESALGANHPDTATLYNNIGAVYRRKCNYDKALEYYLKAMEIRESVLGAPTPDTAGSYDNIGNIYSVKGDYEKTLEYHLKALKIRESVLGANHPDTARSYGNIGIEYAIKGEYDKALEFFLKALKIKEFVLGAKHPETAGSYHNIGTVYSDKGDFDKALEYYLKAVKIKESVLGKNHSDTALSYNNIGSVYAKKCDYDKAMVYYLKALKIRESVLGGNHPDTATSYNNIGNVYSDKGDYAKALEYKLKALEIREKVLGEDHINTVYSYNDIAWTYHLLGKYDDALSYVEKAVKVSPDDANIIDTLATVYQGLGRYDEAMEQFELCLKLQKEENASEDSIRDTEEKMEELKKMMKN